MDKKLKNHRIRKTRDFRKKTVFDQPTKNWLRKYLISKIYFYFLESSKTNANRNFLGKSCKSIFFTSLSLGDFKYFLNFLFILKRKIFFLLDQRILNFWFSTKLWWRYNRVNANICFENAGLFWLRFPLNATD